MIGTFLGLKSKNYAFSYVKEYVQFLNGGNKSKLVRCKGTTRTTIKDEMNIDSLVNTLIEGTLTKNDNYCIRSNKHQLGLYKIEFIML